MSEVTSTGCVNGSDLLARFKGKAVGSCSSHQITYNTETKERAVKPKASKGKSSGKWKNKGIVGLNISGTADGLIFYDETEFGFKSFLAAYKKAEPIELELFERDGDSQPYLKGNFIITQIQQTAPAQDDASYSISFENTGEPEIFEPSNMTGEDIASE